MNHRLLGTAAALVLVAGGASMLAMPSPLIAAPSKGGKPQMGSFGVDMTGMDKAVKPGDDFFKFVNGAWYAKTEIPADRSSWGGFTILRDLSDRRTHDIIDLVSKQKNIPGSAAQKVGDFFASFMDEAAIEAKGMEPVKPLLTAIDAIQTPDDVSHAFATANRLGIATPVSIAVQLDLKDNSQYAAYVGQGGLGLPDRDYYLVDNDRFNDVRAKYKTHIAAMFKLAGLADADAKADAVFALERKIAETHWTQAQDRQVDKLYNPYPKADLAAAMPGFEWNGFVQGAGLASQPRIIVAEVSAVKAAAAMVSSEPVAVWRDYLKYHTLSAAAPMLSKAWVDESFAFNGKVLSGTPALKERWKRGVDVINGSLGEAVGQVYVAKYFPPASKAKADTLVKNLIKAMDARLAKVEWMSPETRTKARAKLAAFTPKIGYPDKWRDYSALRVERGDLWGNAMRATEFDYNRELAKIGKPVDRSEWGMTPQTVNAYANPLWNEIVFPAAILQPPFFDANADAAVNYGGIGAVIGHEISHHFDDQGRKFDSKGNMAEWWSPEDVARFEKLTKNVVAQYGAYEPLPGQKVNGELTLGENIADLAGITIAYDAYKMSLGGKAAPMVGGYTGDQRFFLGFGQIWQTKYRDQNLLQRLTSDPHTPGHFRPYVVRNIDAWYTAFGVKPGEKLYLKPEDRARIW